MINVKRVDPNNIGDVVCSPFNYFDFGSPDVKTIDIYSAVKNGLDGDTIFGGGGLFYFEKELKQICTFAPKNLKFITWGLGTNFHYSFFSKPFLKKQYPSYVQRFDLLGTRDYGLSKNWVPCVSCLDSVFDKHYEIQNEFVYYQHGSFGKQSWLSELPTMNNSGELEAVIKFLGTADTIITNTYHGMYWGILLNRKVIALPWKTSFYHMKYKVPMCTIKNWKNYLKKTTHYPEALDECRKANINFSFLVSELLDREIKLLNSSQLK